MATTEKHNSRKGKGIVLRDAEQVTCSDAMLKLLEIRLRSLSKDATSDLISLIPEFNACESQEELADLSQTVRELIFPELVGGLRTVDTESVSENEALHKRMNFIGQRIKDRRKAADMNQEELAKKSGLPQSHISRLEAGKHSPSYRTLEKVAKALGVEIGDLDPSY